MALHLNSATMAIEAIDEYIEAADNCRKALKPSGGSLGYPATLLLFCVTNAFGVYLRGESVQIDRNSQKITSGEPFRVLNHPVFGLNLKSTQIKLLEKSYRNALAHTAIIEPGAFVVRTQGQNPSAPFTFATNKIQVINLDSFYELVAGAWKVFPRDKIDEWAKNRPKRP